MYYSAFLVFLVLAVIELTSGSGSTDSAAIRAIESDIRRVKTNSDGIVAELKKQKEATTSLQNEFKWLHNELKAFKKSISDIDLLVNKTSNDTQFIRDKMSDLSEAIRKMVTPTPINKNASSSTPSPAPSKKFILF